MTSIAIAATAVTVFLTAGVGAGISEDILPDRAMPVMLAAWAAMIVVTSVLWSVRWAIRRLLGKLTAVRDLSGIVAADLTRGAGSRPEGSIRQAR